MSNFNKGITKKPDGKIGINNTNPQVELDVNGGLKIGGTLITQEGVIRWNPGGKYYEYYDGSSWVRMGGGNEWLEWPLNIEASVFPIIITIGNDADAWSDPMTQYQTYIDNLESATVPVALSPTVVDPLQLPANEA